MNFVGLENTIKGLFEGFYHIWPCDLDHLYKLSLPFPKGAPYKIWLWLAMPFEKKRSLKIIDIYITVGMQTEVCWSGNTIYRSGGP